LHQEHGLQGTQVEALDTKNYIFESVGDYLFTQKLFVGIGVVTADCLPIIFYDSVTHTAGIAHAGWKGLSKGIIQLLLEKMIKATGLVQANLEIYLGPCAGSCCYQVQQDFINYFIDYKDNRSIFMHKNNKIYFNFRAFIIVVARSLGIDEEKIYTRYNVCTICNISFCSYRREKEKARRQVTMICLH
jgi:YfiH family protein